MHIQYIPYQQIDKAKWDACIDKATNGLVYGYSIYLDCMCKQWDALVLFAGNDPSGNYEAVMPLTWNKKYGIYYLYQPPFTACLGVFGRSLNEEILAAFLHAIPPKFKYWDISLNHGNVFKPAGFTVYERMNYVLSLSNSYQTLYTAFRDNLKRNIKKAEQLQLDVKKNIDVRQVSALAKEQATGFSTMTSEDYDRFEKLYRQLYDQKKATSYGVFTTAGQLIASAIFLFSHGRAYYIMVGNHPNGKTLGASHALINAFIKDHAGEDLLLDFEGSDISSLGFFYSSFRAVEEKYTAIKLNKLPAPIKWLKK